MGEDSFLNLARPHLISRPDQSSSNAGMRYGVGVVKFFKVPFIKCFSTDFGPKVTDLPSVFHLTSIWSCKAASKSEAVKSTLLNKSCSNQKILADLLYQL